MNNKKILALVLAFAMIFSSMVTAFASTPATTSEIGTDAAALKTMGVLQGDDGGVTAAYLAKETTRMQAAIMFLRLKGLEDEAMAFTGTANFSDASSMTWAQGKAIMAYLKANPQLGWVGADAGKFNPLETITVNQYYKVMLEALGYKQTTTEVVGDFSWADVMTFAASKGLVKVANAAKFTNNDVAIATIEALKTNVKDTTTTLATVLVDAGMINKAAAIAAGVYVDVPALTAAVKSAKATGNTAVEVTFADAVNAGAANAALYTIAGLEVKSAVVSGGKTVILTTAAQTTGKLYTMTVGAKDVTFSGIAKVSDGPQLTTAASNDVEEVVLTFDRNMDYATATNVANYTIAGVVISKATVDENKVTLTTVGLKDKTNYTVKATNLKSIDGVARKSTSNTFRSNYDTAYPRIDSANTAVQTNQRIMLHFNEDVTKESAENISNYSIKVNETNGAELEIISATQDADNENVVELVTAPMVKNENYKLSVNGIADQRNVANVITRAATFTFKGMAEDTKAPTLVSAKVLSKNLLLVEFADSSKIDETSALDTNNYTFTQGSDTLNVNSIETLKNVNGTFKALVTVDDMEISKSYKLEVVDILDEFGNAMKTDSETLNPVIADFASAKLAAVNGIVINNKNTITLTFDKGLKEATAENIANYSINGNIGTPTKAEYEKDGAPANSVTLTVNELTNGVKYSITINGVQDLAGNVLNVTKKDIVATAGTQWDVKAPELDSAYADNQYVAALQFNEAVKFETGTQLWLTSDDGTYTTANPLKLDAKTTTNDDTVVEFSKYASGAWVTLDDSVNYSVYKVVYGPSDDLGGIKDLIGNRFMTSDDQFTFDGSISTPDYSEVDSYNQTNGGTFEVTMSKNVAFKNPADVLAEKATVNGFDVTIDNNVVTLVRNAGGLTEDANYDFNLNDFLVDENGMEVVNSDTLTSTVLVGEQTDTDAPYITGVQATDRQTIEVTFSEDIKAAVGGNFKIKNVDTDKNVTIASVSKIDGDVITLTLTTPLEGRYGYELTMTGNVVKDFANNTADSDVYNFDGTDLAK